MIDIVVDQQVAVGLLRVATAHVSSGFAVLAAWRPASFVVFLKNVRNTGLVKRVLDITVRLDVLEVQVVHTILDETSLIQEFCDAQGEPRLADSFLAMNLDDPLVFGLQLLNQGTHFEGPSDDGRKQLLHV